jgi:hypothetical protein
MRSDDLTKAQARALENKLAPMLGYLTRLKRRMVRRGFPLDDPLLNAVLRAEGAVHDLHVAMHYLTCAEQTGGLPRQSDDEAESGGN